MFLFLLAYLSAVALLSVFRSGKIIRRLVTFGLVLGVLIDGLRLETGTDWLPYFNHFTYFSTTDLKDYGYFEPGYQYVVWLVRQVSDSYSVFLCLHAFVVYFGIYHEVFRLAEFRPISVVLLYGNLSALLGSNRQLLALAFMVHSIKYLTARRPVAFALTLLAGAMFHKTILVFAPFYLVFGLSLLGCFLTFASALVVVSIVATRLTEFADAVTNLSFSDSNHYDVYIGRSAANVRPFLALLRKGITIGAPLLTMTSHYSRLKQHDRGLLRFFALAAAMSFPLYAAALIGLSAFNSRLDIYFGTVFSAILGGWVESRLVGTGRKFALVILLIAVAFVSFYQNPFSDLFDPYKSLWFNRYVERKLY
jgi:hypothetical protein